MVLRRRRLNRIKRFFKSDKELRRQFSRYKWVTKFEIDGCEYGGWYDAAADRRLRQFAERFPDSRRILELGSLEGGHTLGLSRLPDVTQVLGLEGRDYNVEKANFIKTLTQSNNVEFRQCDLEDADFSDLGAFDAVFSVGLLYHLREPWRHLDALARVSRNLFLWTHYADEAKARETVNGFKGWRFQERGYDDPLSGLSAYSFWPTLDSLKSMITTAGFPRIEVIETNPKHPHGCCVTLTARRGLPEHAASASSTLESSSRTPRADVATP